MYLIQNKKRLKIIPKFLCNYVYLSGFYYSDFSYLILLTAWLLESFVNYLINLINFYDLYLRQWPLKYCIPTACISTSDGLNPDFLNRTVKDA